MGNEKKMLKGWMEKFLYNVALAKGLCSLRGCSSHTSAHRDSQIFRDMHINKSRDLHVHTHTDIN